MENKKTTVQKTFLTLLLLSGWFAVIFQLYLFLKSQSGILPVSEILIRFFSFFTIDSNLIVALCATFLLFGKNTKPGAFFSRQSNQTAVAVYILVVGLIYNVILRFIWDPQGLQKVVDELLHSVNPLLFVLYWGIYSTKNHLSWRSFLPWLIYPVVYTFFIFIRGSFAGYYPYPFLDVNVIGMKMTIINCLLVTLVFVVVSLIFIAIGNLIVKRRSNNDGNSL